MIVHPHWNAIAAMAENRVIGRGGALPWHLPEDFRWFKQTTLGHPVVMGRRTFESLGRPLPGRRNLVFSRSGVTFPGAETVPTMEALGDLMPDTGLFIIGGAEVFRQLLPFCGTLYLSLVRGAFDGDVFFPDFDPWFELDVVLADHGAFEIRRYANRVIPSGLRNQAADESPA